MLDGLIVMSGYRAKARPPPPISTYDNAMPPGLKRLQSEGDLHFITFSCHDRLPYLNPPKSKQVIEDMLETLRARHDFAILGYVLMPEHVHLLMTEPKTGSVASTIRVLKGETSKLLRGTRQHFWLPRYYDFNVFTEAKRIEKLQYIHRNPVARELVTRPEDWPWSSFLPYATHQPGHITIQTPNSTIPAKPRPPRP
jgi:putative transposase